MKCDQCEEHMNDCECDYNKRSNEPAKESKASEIVRTRRLMVDYLESSGITHDCKFIPFTKRDV